jgi:uncharacterized MAPEG superfamily protein
VTIPFWCVVAALALIYLPRLLVIRALVKLPGGLDNNNPRDQQAKLEGFGRRANAAHNNSIEAFAPFAAAVIIAHLSHANERWSSILAVAFIALRCLYVAAYLGDQASLRSCIWMGGLGTTAALMLLGAFSGN